MNSAVMGWIVSLRTTLRISADAGADSKTATATHCKIRGIVIFVIVSRSGRRNRETVARRPLQNTPTLICELRFASFYSQRRLRLAAPERTVLKAAGRHSSLGGPCFL